MSKQQQDRLGKGLEALLGGNINVDDIRKPVEYINKTPATPGVRSNSADIMLIPIDSIEPNPFQPRTDFDEDTMNELAESIRALGLIQPITVRSTAGGKYQIISGERRWRACRIADYKEMPAYIKDTNDSGMLEMAIVENVQREDLDPIEVALGYQRLIYECNLTQEQMAGMVGKNRASIANYLRLLKLPDKVQHDLKVGLVSVGHAKVLLEAADAKTQERLCDLVISEGLSIKQLEERLHKLKAAAGDGNPRTNTTGPQNLPETYHKVLDIIGKYFHSNISLKRSTAGKGAMTVYFDSDDEMAKFLKALEESNL
ncbi:MAG: ParB/RepB/Spo0J family partition protein [Bacteroidales bacterium]|nr:ParB/RepB/Spo0J family partition protein [Bacteroidales bacterium]